jgi:hypothetical protein
LRLRLHLRQTEADGTNSFAGASLSGITTVKWFIDLPCVLLYEIICLGNYASGQNSQVVNYDSGMYLLQNRHMASQGLAVSNWDYYRDARGGAFKPLPMA